MSDRDQNLNSVLLDILEKKEADIVEQKKNFPLAELRKRIEGKSFEHTFVFKKSMEKPKEGNVALIAEIKLASPADPLFHPEVNVLDRAIAYESAGADAISYITEKHYFRGDVSVIQQIKLQVNLPVLQKDFVIDQYQIYEAKDAGADALLFIARIVDEEVLIGFVDLAKELGIEPVVEVNDEEDLEKALATATEIIAVNARDLRDFTVDAQRACELLGKIPDRFIKLGFSGVGSAADVRMYKHVGARGVLVGSSLMKADNVGEFIKSLRA